MFRQEFSEPLNSVICDLVPLLRRLFVGRYAIAVAGSHGKNKSDELSDIDLRTYYDAWIDDDSLRKLVQLEIDEKIFNWAKCGVKIDGYWPRPIFEIDSKLEAIIRGTNTDPDPCRWTIWGYYLPTDIVNNMIIEDPFFILKKWKKQLLIYPDVMKNQIIKKNLNNILYWRNDYHYESKVNRKDILFCTGLASLLIHNMVQIIFSLNNIYYSGDGWNLKFIETFTIVPTGFIDEIPKILLMNDIAGFKKQRTKLCHLIDQIEQLVYENYKTIEKINSKI